MTRSRVQRLERTREQRRRYYTLGAVAFVAVGILAVAVGIGLASADAPTQSGTSSADVLLALEPSSESTPLGSSIPSGPAAVPIGGPGALEPTPETNEPAAPKSSGYVVCLDPGHQAHANTDPEPIGPKSSETKPKVTGGAAGVVTRQPEYELVLDVATRVKALLEAQRVKVVMTRTSSDVDVSNSERAEVANDAGADLFVRIHADSNTNADISGASTLYPGGNEWVEPIEADSLAAARIVHEALVTATGAADRGIVKRSDLAGFNYCEVPAVLVEMGFLSNPVEDRRLAEDTYRDKVAQGIADGVMSWLER